MKKLLSNIKIFITLALFLILPTAAFALIPLSVNQGGTGVNTITGIIQGNGTAPFSAITVGTGLSFTGGTLSAPGTAPGGLNLQVQYNNGGVFGGISGAVTNGTILNLTNPLIGGATITTSTLNGVTLTTGGSATTYLNGAGAYTTPAGAISSVSNSDGTLTISPTTGAVVASLALGHANTWTGAQIFYNSTTTLGVGTVIAKDATHGILAAYYNANNYAIWPGGVTPSGTNYGILFNNNGTSTQYNSTDNLEFNISDVTKMAINNTGVVSIATLNAGGLVKAASTSGNLSIASAGTDYQAPIALTTTGTSGAATFISNTLNIPNYTYTLPTASTSVLGGVKVDGTSITISGGVISATAGGSGTVTSVASADGSITVTNPTTTVDLAVVKAPIWSTARLLAGNSVNGSANVAFANKFIVQGTTDAGLSGAQFLGSLGTGIVKNTTTTGVLSIAVAADFPTLNQNTTGSAATLTTPRTIGTVTGDATSAGSTFDGSANNTNALTLTTVNSNVGSFGSSTSIPTFTVNAKGLITAASGNVVIAPAGTLSGTTLNSTVVTSSLTSVGTIGTGVWQGTVVAGQYGGTGVANTGKTITLGGNLTTSGAFATTLTSTAATNVTLPITGTLATLAGAEALTNKSVNGVTLVTGGTSTLYLSQDGTYTTPSGGGGMAIGGSITSATAGSILFAGTAGVLAQDNTNFFWDNTNKRLGIGVNTPNTVLQIKKATNPDFSVISGTGKELRFGVEDSNSQVTMASNGSGAYPFAIKQVGNTLVTFDGTGSEFTTSVGIGVANTSPMNEFLIGETASSSLWVNFNGGNGIFEIGDLNSLNTLTKLVVDTGNGAASLSAPNGFVTIGDTFNLGSRNKIEIDDIDSWITINGHELRITDTSLAGASNGYVWTLTDQTTGTGGWAAASGGVTSVSGTANRITSTGGATPVIDISASYVGQTSITTVGTLTAGTIGAGFTAIANARLANSSVTIGSTNIALGATSTTLAGLTSVTSTSFVGALTGNASTATNVAVGGITGLGTGVATALAVNVGTAGAFVVNGGALGTPSSGTLTNATGLPIAGLTASTTTALGVGSIELGNASDTTLARVSAGVASIEGVTIDTASNTLTLTNKTFNTAGTGNVFQINGTGITAVSGSGAVCLVTNCALVTPSLGAATYTTLSGGNITDSGLTAGRVTFAGTAGLLSDDADMTFATDTLTVTKIAATTFTGNITLSTKNIVTDTTTGTMIGTGSTQKLGFFGATPVVQQTGNISTALSNLGLVTSGTLPIGSVSGLGTGIATFLGTPSSANLASAITDETGSGLLVFGTNPSISGATLTSSSLNGVTLTTGGSATTFLNGAGSYTTPTSASFIAQDIPTVGGSGIPDAGAGQGSIITSNSTGTVLYLAQSDGTSTIRIFRLAKDANTGNYYVTHNTTFASAFTPARYYGMAVVGSSLYLSIDVSGSVPGLERYVAADLTSPTVMSFSGTARRGPMWGDATSLHIWDSTTTDQFVTFTLSGTTATNAGSITYTSSGNSTSATSDGTNVWMTNINSAGGTNNIRKYPIAGGAVTSTTTISPNSAAYLSGTTLQLFLGSSSTLGMGWFFNWTNATSVSGEGIHLMGVTLP